MVVGELEVRFDDEETSMWEVVVIVSGELLAVFASEQAAIDYATVLMKSGTGQ